MALGASSARATRILAAFVSATKPQRKRGRPPKAVVEHPEPLTSEWIDPDCFSAALTLHATRHGDSLWHLHKAVTRPGEAIDRKTVQDWAAGRKMPRTSLSYTILTRIEHRYRLPDGYFRSRLPVSGRAQSVQTLAHLSEADRRRLAWHLPPDFDDRSVTERAEIVAWVRRVIISGSTDYRVFQAQAMTQRYALRFPNAHEMMDGISNGWHVASTSRCQAAPHELVDEVAQLIQFKTKTLTAIGECRTGVWGEETAVQKIEHLALMFGALAAPADGEVHGRGVPRSSLAIALLAFPAVWDWYLAWREARRGFFTTWEINMLGLVLALTRAKTGWLWQNPSLADRLEPIAGLLSVDDITAARNGWEETCAAMQAHALARSKEVKRVARVHRDPFEPILTVLEAESPVREYRRITTEIISRMPDAARYPVAAAEAVRGFLMLRLGLHLGVRQKNLRQLLVCRRGDAPRTERQLETMKRGELRWNDREAAWEVLIPAVAFKNANSSFFGRKPFRLRLPDLDNLYAVIEQYITSHRQMLLGSADDPSTFFIKTVKRSSSNAAYDQATFYESWRLVIQRYGIYNPYTNKGAINGLLPHGPHNVRDVLATHVLKQTGSYEQASYAIQDTPEMVAMHYGRFLPEDKAAVAARVLNEAWAA